MEVDGIAPKERPFSKYQTGAELKLHFHVSSRECVLFWGPNRVQVHAEKDSGVGGTEESELFACVSATQMWSPCSNTSFCHADGRFFPTIKPNRHHPGRGWCWTSGERHAAYRMFVPHRVRTERSERRIQACRSGAESQNELGKDIEHQSPYSVDEELGNLTFNDIYGLINDNVQSGSTQY